MESRPQGNKHAPGRAALHLAVAAERSIEQDPAFGIQQILDIAVRALSPGINTPRHCGPVHRSRERYLRRARAVHAACRARRWRRRLRDRERPTFDALADAALAPLMRDAAGNAQMLVHLEHCVRRILAVTPPQRRISIQRHIGASESARRVVA